ncbi:MAG: AAA family ATPase [Planctomycetota bacterium]
MGYIFDALQQQRQASSTPAPPQDEPAAPKPDIYSSVIPPATDASEPAPLAIQPETAEPNAIAPSQPLASNDFVIPGADEALAQPEFQNEPQTPAEPAFEYQHTATPLALTEPIAPPHHHHDDAWIDGLDDRLVAVTDPASPTAEEYRSIRTSMLARHQRARHLVHLITSATPQEGKTLTTVNLGLALAELPNRRTLIIEADLRLPNFDALLNLPANSPGLLGILRGEETPENAIQAVGPNELHILPAGGRTTNEAVTLLSSNRMSQLVQRLSQDYDHVLIDTPPVVELADAGILSSLCHEVLLIARMRRTPGKLIEQAIKTLKSYHAPVAGLIATDNIAHIGSGYSRYGYGYRYGYRYAYAKPKGRKSRSKKAAAAKAA